MIIIKVIETGLNIDNPLEVYNSAQDSIKAILIKLFKGRCFHGCLIIDILRVIKISECIIDSRGAGCVGKVNVMFEVRAIAYMPGELLVGCKILKKDRAFVAAAGLTESVLMVNSAVTGEMQIGQLLPIVVGDSTCPISKDKISIKGMPFIPNISYTYYKINHTLSPGDRAQLAPVLKMLAEEQAACNSVENKRGLEFFAGIISPYKKASKLANAKEKNITDLITEGVFSGYYARDKRIKATDGIVYEYDSPIDEPHASLASVELVKGVEAITMIIHDWISMMRFVRELNATFSTQELLNAHKNLWRVYSHAKI